ncbi:MAG: hypothetical protein MUF64_21960 [Polyangiaceae bacterium]|jgi:hypothetical protein|nr:hypothetical protein [Polyangiaceae bacterium]
MSQAALAPALSPALPGAAEPEQAPIPPQNDLKREETRAGAPPARPPVDAEQESAPEGIIELLLRAPERFLEHLERHHEPLALTRALLGTVALGAGVFGAVVGAHRGGLQIAYAAVKVPLLLLGTMAISMPAFISLARAFRVRMEAREVVVLSLGACARFALVLAGLAPILWLLEGWLGYHATALVVALTCAAAGVSASSMLFRGLTRRQGSLAAGLAFLAVFGIVGAQTSWLLRPFLVRPRATSVPFVRGLEGDLLDSVWRSSRSAAGVYDERSDDLP